LPHALPYVASISHLPVANLALAVILRCRPGYARVSRLVRRGRTLRARSIRRLSLEVVVVARCGQPAEAVSQHGRSGAGISLCVAESSPLQPGRCTSSFSPNGSFGSATHTRPWPPGASAPYPARQSSSHDSPVFNRVPPQRNPQTQGYSSCSDASLRHLQSLRGRYKWVPGLQARGREFQQLAAAARATACGPLPQDAQPSQQQQQQRAHVLRCDELSPSNGSSALRPRWCAAEPP
jgi:hypothetical protein